MAEQDRVLVPIEMSMKGYQMLQYNRSRGHQEESFEAYVEKMALLGSLVTKIQEEHEGVVVFEGVEGERTLIDDKIAAELSSSTGNVTFLPLRQS